MHHRTGTIDQHRRPRPVGASRSRHHFVGKDEAHTIYAGSLDDPSLFQPKIAIFAASRPQRAVIPQGLPVYERMPP